MIRINLQKNASAAVSSETKVTDDGLSYGEVIPINWPQVILRVLLLVLPVYGLHYYSTDIVDKRKKQLAKVKRQDQAIEKRLQELSSQIESLSRYEQEKKKLEQQIRVIGELSKHRLLGIVSVDTIQALLPKRTWMTSVTLQQGLMSISGYAYNDSEISDLIQGLEEIAFFTDVALGNSIEERTERGVLKRFQINFRLESI